MDAILRSYVWRSAVATTGESVAGALNPRANRLTRAQSSAPGSTAAQRAYYYYINAMLYCLSPAEKTAVRVVATSRCVVRTPARLHEDIYLDGSALPPCDSTRDTEN